MLKDQYFIEVLVSILKNLLMKHEFELFARKKDKFLDKLRESTSKLSSPRRTTISRKTASPSRMSMSPRKELDRFRYLEFIKKKMDFCEELYRLLAEIAENYPDAQNEIYNLVPPMNLINYYMNLIWDGESTIKQEYMRFLRCLCKFGDRGININQEMIFKLYNCMVMARRSNPFVHARV